MMKSCSPRWPQRARLFAFVVALTMITSFAWAAGNDEPQKINIDGAGYNASTQNFEIQLSANFGIATAGKRAGFVVVSTVLIFDDTTGTQVASLTGVAPVVRAGGSRGSDLVPLVDQLIFWDRNCGTVAGPVTLEISSQLQKKVADAADTHPESGVDLDGGPTAPSAEISHIEPLATTAGIFLPWIVIISISVFVVIHRWLKKPFVS